MTEEAAKGGRILVVEDESDIAAIIAYQLTREGFTVETASTGPDGLTAAARDIPGLVVLDLMLPGISGLEVLRRLRQDSATREVPVLVLTARRDQEDRIQGLEAGADDYLTKPFSPKELVLRVNAILRRSRGRPFEAGGKIVRAGPFTLDVGANRVELNGEELALTPTEFRLLLALLERRGRTLSRRKLLEEAWELDPGVADRLQTRTVDMHVRRLRGKLGGAGDWIYTVRGFGYRFELPASYDGSE